MKNCFVPIKKKRKALMLTNRWLQIAVCKWITSVPLGTCAHRDVIDYGTKSYSSTRAWAWVDTFMINASFITRAFRVYRTLGSAIGWLSNIVIKACACCYSVDVSTFGIATTGRWDTWVGRAWCNCLRC
jgi:hypothetical protein